MARFLFLFYIFFSCSYSFAQVVIDTASVANTKRKYELRDSSGFGNDGPYVFYSNGFMVSKRISKVQGKYEVVIDTLLNGERNVYVERDHATKKGFEVNIAKRHRKHKSFYPIADSVFVVSDIEGSFEAMEALLISAGVMDANYNWTYGNGQLVVLGDVYDRGLEVTQCLWLIYRLEQLAPEGSVHMVVGNHEAMNMFGSLYYVRNKYWLVSYALAMDLQQLNAKNTVLGKWLRSKNVVVKLGDVIFAHGGLSPFLVEEELSAEKMNKLARKNYDKIKLKGKKKLILGGKGPMWYRGYFMPQKGKYEQITELQLDSVLQHFDAKQVVVGHTIVPSITPKFNYKLYPVDVSHRERLNKKLPTEGLLIRDNVFYRHCTNGERVRLCP